MTEAQEYEAFRASVEASLRIFYHRSPPAAAALVSKWWKRLSATSAFTTGIFLHSEPINTAASLAGADVVEITGENEVTYLRLLERCSAEAIRPKKEHLLEQRKLQHVTLSH